jgi:hypothetical protein
MQTGLLSIKLAKRFFAFVETGLTLTVRFSVMPALQLIGYTHQTLTDPNRFVSTVMFFQEFHINCNCPRFKKWGCFWNYFISSSAKGGGNASRLAGVVVPTWPVVEDGIQHCLGRWR